MSDAAYFEQPSLWGGSAAAGPHARRVSETIALIPRDVETLADLGAGDGALQRELSRQRNGIAVISLDRSGAALEHVHGTRVAGSVSALPLRDRAVECATICEVIEHLPVASYEATLLEVARVAACYVVITVPNREDRRRGRVTCAACGCRFNRFQHLRSFDPEAMSRLVRGFEMIEVRELGPRAPWYPWWAAVALERAGLFRRIGAPICPQCGSGEESADHHPTAASQSALKRFLPHSSRRIWLGALYRRARSL